MELPAEIYSVENVRKIDQAAIQGAGINGYTLMTRAGKAAFDAAICSFPDARRWQVICGCGNNGGDAYIVARLAVEQGMSVSAVTMVPPKNLAGDAATAYMDFVAAGGNVVEWEEGLDNAADLLIDGLLGSGLKRDVKGRYAELVNAMNEHKAPILALDMPSGLNGNNGKIMGEAVQADTTVTFVALKSGLFIGRGPELAGELLFHDLGIPDECRDGQLPIFRRINNRILQTVLPRRERNTHKGKFGHVLVIGGAPGMSGAVRLCGEAALRSGAGLVSIATHPTHSEEIVSARPELMSHGVECSEELDPLLAKATAIAIGPGLGTESWARKLLEKTLESELPTVIDADALNLFTDMNVKSKDWILTPHPGEAARLLGIRSTDVQSNRLTALLNLKEKFGGTVVLKGAGTLVVAQEGRPWICSVGNPGMATAGMGDVLTGIIVALRAQHIDAEMAAVVGVQVHALAGDKAAGAGERGLVASDLFAEIRHWINL